MRPLSVRWVLSSLALGVFLVVCLGLLLWGLHFLSGVAAP